ncbi:MAG TPA: ParA family protein [Methylophilaceae bacterium]|jgi:chromosome partitioning protein
MKHILVANPKGGSGKSTLATNLAGYYAAQGKHVTLADLDRQQSSIQWLQRRSEKLPLIHGVDARHNELPDKTDFLIVDSPAGIHGEKLSDIVKRADCVIIPIQPSAFDIGATRDFLAVLEEEKAVRKQKTFVAVVGMRVDTRTRSSGVLLNFLQDTQLPMPTYLRNAQIYAVAAEQGSSIFDLPKSKVTVDLPQWAPLTAWIKRL